MKTLFELSDYKAWMKQRIRSLPRGGHGELSRIAQHLGVHVTLVSHILKADKDFTVEQGYLLTEYFGLTELETEFFILLVQINRAGNHKLHSFYNRQLGQLKTKSLDLQSRFNVDRRLSLEESSKFYSSWLYSAVRIFTSIHDGCTRSQIQSYFHLGDSETDEILEFLIECKLCQKQGDRYSVGPQTTHLPFGSTFLKSHLKNWRIKALESANGLSADEVMYSSCLSLSEKDFKMLREKMAALIQDVQLTVKTTIPSKMVVFNLDWSFLKP